MSVFIVIHTDEAFKIDYVESVWHSIEMARLAVRVHAEMSRQPVHRYTIIERQEDVLIAPSPK